MSTPVDVATECIHLSEVSAEKGTSAGNRRCCVAIDSTPHGVKTQSVRHFPFRPLPYSGYNGCSGIVPYRRRDICEIGKYSYKQHIDMS